MRLFVALVPPPEAVAELAAAVAVLRDEHRGLRWVPPERWHLTLAFCGDVDGALVPDLGRRLQVVVSQHPAPRLAVAGAGSFGSRVLWAGVHGDVGAACRLAAAVGAAARAAGVDVEDRPHRPHLTLARVPGRAAGRGAPGRPPPDLVPLVTALAGVAGPEWTPSGVHLVRSRLGAEPSYEVLLTAAPGRSPAVPRRRAGGAPRRAGRTGPASPR